VVNIILYSGTENVGRIHEIPEMITPSQATAAALRKHIQMGQYAVGQRLSNERLLSKQFSVNRGTIRKALKLLEEERLIVRKHGHGTFVTTPVFSNTQQIGSALIGALVYGPYMAPEREYFFGPILEKASMHAAKKGYVLSTGSNTTEESEHCYIEAFIRNKIKGLILAPRIETSFKTYNRIIKEGVPIVLLDTIIPDCEEDFVGTDNFHGTEIATHHLIKLGHKRIAYLGPEHPERVRGQIDRKTGFLITCNRSGLSIPTEHIIEYDVPILETCKESDINNFHIRLKDIFNKPNRPTAIVAYNDMWAQLTIKTARKLSFNIPKDLSVVGFDNSNTPLFSDIPLTTIDPKPNDIGEAIMDLLITKVENPNNHVKRSLLINPALIIRDSTAKVPEGV
jgi:GntR family transcriptional regulator of arabinose operon